MIQVGCCSSLLSAPGRAGAFSRDFTIIFKAPESRAFSGALKIEKLKVPLIPGPEGDMDTNDWCITVACSHFYVEYDILNLFAVPTCKLFAAQQTQSVLFWTPKTLNDSSERKTMCRRRMSCVRTS